ncbi:hypothetical protein I7I51_07857 [Histoplasma capsulatum]|uniref:Uncharacterized protein n=1 Tax=Ajellomyces capsulatus TaxID=5037 RepID=A0A8A1LXD1_AJECA|nr:predicted protein [Histoplasma mississippiense (nom. inval.)]EDN02835.1 predicted protein [Histoplasma mississippiense (nom. inval.)]QSS58431.1 hypothetical protein I7I51_07857 [Histoplasma capsulatum]
MVPNKVVHRYQAHVFQGHASKIPVKLAMTYCRNPLQAGTVGWVQCSWNFFASRHTQSKVGRAIHFPPLHIPTASKK